MLNQVLGWFLSIRLHPKLGLKRQHVVKLPYHTYGILYHDVAHMQ